MCGGGGGGGGGVGHKTAIISHLHLKRYCKLTLILTSIVFRTQKKNVRSILFLHVLYVVVLITYTIDSTPPDKPSLQHHCLTPV